jgi:hypothetical protein
MKIVSKTVLIFLVLFCISSNGITDNLTQQTIDKQFNVGYGSCTKTMCSRMPRQEMINEIVAMWNMWLDDHGLSKDEPRRKRFPKYAEYIVDAVRLYQTKELYIGGKLPMGRNVHLIIASMAIYETAVRHWIVGWKKGEVGLLQIHGVALMKYKPEKVRYNPRLGIKLGVRWLAYHTQFCTPNPTDDIDQWAEVLSLYSAGINRGMKPDGTCKRISVAEDRANTAKEYAERIRNEKRI